MTEQFDSIDIQVYISPSWVSLWADVCNDPPVRWNRGIMDNKVTSYVASPGYLSFDLDNSESNSVGTVGYYTPSNANHLTGFAVGIPIRLAITYEGQTFYKFYGHILPDGIQTDPGSKSARRVHVSACDYFGIAARHEIKGIQVLSNKTIVEAVGTVLANMSVVPLSTAYTSNPVYTFPTVFDNVSTGITTAMAEFQKLAASEQSNIYVTGDCSGGEVLRVEGRDDRYGLSLLYTSKSNSESDTLLTEDGDFLLLETGDQILINDVRTSAEITEQYLSSESDIGYGRQIINRVKVTTNPRRVDTGATTTLWQLQDEFWIAPGTLTGINGSYRDPSGGNTRINGADMVAPVAYTHYTAGTASGGTTATGSLSVSAAYGSDSVEYTLINSAAGSICVTMLKAIGNGVYLYDPATNISDSIGSQEQYGIFSTDVDLRYQNDPSSGNYITSILLTNYVNPNVSLDRGVVLANRDGFSMYAFLQIEPGVRCFFSESVSGLSASQAVVNGYDAEIIGGSIVNWYPVVKKVVQYI